MLRPSVLLALADEWVGYNRTKPRSEVLRRAVSTAYYARFHALIDRALDQVAGKDPAVRATVGRWFEHKTMVQVCRHFAQPTKKPMPLPKLQSAFQQARAPSAALSSVAKAFDDLQGARHEADYNRAAAFTRQQATVYVQQAAAAFKSAQICAAQDPLWPLFLPLLLTGDGPAQAH